MYTTTIQKWGNSFAMRLPLAFIKGMELREGQCIALKETGDGKVAFMPLGRAIGSLDELVLGIHAGNKHDPVNWGAPRGKEAW